MADEGIQQLRHDVALACRILALTGMTTETLGHVSARVPGGSDEMLIRSRADDEPGLLFTRDSDVLRVSFDGAGEIPAGAGPPGEFPIHGEIFKARPEVNCVVHAHPWGALFCGIAGLKLRPIFGSFDPPAMRFALEPLPVFPRSITLLSAEAVAPLLQVMGTANACLMRGHGMTVVGETVQEATIRAVKLEKMARITWLTSQRGRIPAIADEDQAFFRQALSTGHTTETARVANRRGLEGIWRYYVRLLDLPFPPGNLPGFDTFGRP